MQRCHDAPDITACERLLPSILYFLTRLSLHDPNQQITEHIRHKTFGLSVIFLSERWNQLNLDIIVFLWGNRKNKKTAGPFSGSVIISDLSGLLISRHWKYPSATRGRRFSQSYKGWATAPWWDRGKRLQEERRLHLCLAADLFCIFSAVQSSIEQVSAFFWEMVNLVRFSFHFHFLLFKVTSYLYTN